MAFNARVSRGVQVQPMQFYKGIQPLQQKLIGRQLQKFDTLQEQLREQAYLVQKYGDFDSERAAAIESEYGDATNQMIQDLKTTDDMNRIAADFSKIRKRFTADQRIKNLAAREANYKLDMEQALKEDEFTRGFAIEAVRRKYSENPDMLQPTEGFTYLSQPDIEGTAYKYAQLLTPDGYAVGDNEFIKEVKGADGLTYTITKNGKTSKIDKAEASKRISDAVMSMANIEPYKEQLRMYGVPEDEIQAWEDKARESAANIGGLRAFSDTSITRSIVDPSKSKEAQGSGASGAEVQINFRNSAKTQVPIAKNTLTPEEFTDYKNVLSTDIDQKINNIEGLIYTDEPTNYVTPNTETGLDLILGKQQRIIEKNSNGYKINQDKLFNTELTVDGKVLTDKDKLLLVGQIGEYNKTFRLDKQVQEELKKENTDYAKINTFKSFNDKTQYEKDQFFGEGNTYDDYVAERESRIQAAVDRGQVRKMAERGVPIKSRESWEKQEAMKKLNITQLELDSYEEDYKDIYNIKRNTFDRANLKFEMPSELTEANQLKLSENERAYYEEVEGRKLDYTDRGYQKLKEAREVRDSKGNLLNLTTEGFILKEDIGEEAGDNTPIDLTDANTEYKIVGYSEDPITKEVIELVEITQLNKDEEVLSTSQVYVRDGSLNELGDKHLGIEYDNGKARTEMQQQLRMNDGVLYFPPMGSKLGVTIMKSPKSNKYRVLNILPDGSYAATPGFEGEIDFNEALRFYVSNRTYNLN